MNIRNFLFACGLVASGIISACSFNHNDDNLSIRVINTDDRYLFEASYNRKKTREIERYLTRRIQQNDVINSSDQKNDLTITLADRTIFRIKSYPGELRIVLDKSKNSEQGCQEVNEICRGVNEILKAANKKG